MPTVETETALDRAIRYNEANPPLVSLDRINQKNCPHHAICESCGFPAGEHIRRGFSERNGWRCPNKSEVQKAFQAEQRMQEWKDARP